MLRVAHRTLEAMAKKADMKSSILADAVSANDADPGHGVALVQTSIARGR